MPIYWIRQKAEPFKFRSELLAVNETADACEAAIFFGPLFSSVACEPSKLSAGVLGGTSRARQKRFCTRSLQQRFQPREEGVGGGGQKRRGTLTLWADGATFGEAPSSHLVTKDLPKSYEGKRGRGEKSHRTRDHTQ